MKNLLLFKDGVNGRNPSFKDTDKSALNAIVQACVNVELFTIPLYMTSLYSIHGMHQITGQNNFYQGRNWPGMGTRADPKTPNGEAFNAIFSVFIAEMLHLQLASNICKAVGVTPGYTSLALQSSNYGWTCYGPEHTVLPHILDFKDTVAPYDQIKVKLGPVNKEQLALFLAIEETEGDAEKIIKEDKRSKYFPKVPFAGWKPTNTESDLPMFGSIGWMYLCLWEYLSINYSDGTTLWQYVAVSDPVQQDLFNANTKDHKPEYPGMPATVTSNLLGSEELIRIKDMINGITDQGEGGGVIAQINARLNLPPQAVQPRFQPSKENLEADYPAYTDTGKSAPSRDAAARSDWGNKDHFETFQRVMEIVDQVKTWEQWHQEGNVWTADMLKLEGYEQNLKNYPNVPTAEDIAGALNRLKENNKDDSNYILLSHASAGAIAGITTVLNTYWNTAGATFPYPSMSGSGDRMSICWAIFGKAPDLALGIREKKDGVLYHACQGLSLDPDNSPDGNNCAAIEVYHTCKGSNTCKTEGGCGFVAGGGCGSKVAAVRATSSLASRAAISGEADVNKVEGSCSPVFVSAPSDNKCGSYGGCAVPISASQIFPAPQIKNTIMNLFDFGPAPDYSPELFGRMGYKEGDMVYDIAWQAYLKVLENRKQPAPQNPPKPSDIRLAFTPST